MLNIIKLRKNRVSERSPVFCFLEKDKVFSKKGLTKGKKCAVDFISCGLIKSTLVNRGKSAIDKENTNEIHP